MSEKSQFQVGVVDEINTDITGVEIVAGDTFSSVLHCAGTAPTGVILPEDWTACNLSFLANKVPSNNLNGDRVSGLSVGAEGSGYATAPTVSFTAGGGSGAAATAVLGFGISSVSVTVAGDYTTLPTLAATVGTGATFAATMTAVSAAIVGTGFFYTGGDTITLAGGTHSIQAVLNVVSTRLTAFGLDTPGTGYVIGDHITIASDGVSPTAAVIVVDGIGVGGQLSAWHFTNNGVWTTNGANFTQASTTGAGSGATWSGPTYILGVVSINTAGHYTVLPTNPVSQASSSGSGVSGTFTIHWGFNAIAVTAPGTDYDNTSVFTVSGGGGLGGGAATLVLASTGGVKSLTLTNPGSGYVEAPSVSITGGSGTGASATATVGGPGFYPISNFDGTDYAIATGAGPKWIPLQPALFNSITYLQLSCDTQQNSDCIVDFALAPIFQGIHN